MFEHNIQFLACDNGYSWSASILLHSNNLNLNVWAFMWLINVSLL
jgi:hypothetical protein